MLNLACIQNYWPQCLLLWQKNSNVKKMQLSLISETLAQAWERFYAVVNVILHNSIWPITAGKYNNIKDNFVFDPIFFLKILSS